ncbi:carboxypeptidase-like regulatory domain-containing protein [Thermus sp.]|uniref:carboxypeptidase-like regulatory domain-containing protein n=1 Tax=Thermus sp. TaxID=275 RepID=UPI0025D99042|nr:carboxypeptidase-like regulatory domain-containing protein [Thermus sp.]MCS6869616.1 carboxypeptidase-like regulatory domain-containing protein [Thermus sp.]
MYWEGPQGAWAARTDTRGRFSLFLPPGAYTVWVEGLGLAASRVEGLEIQPGANALDLVVLPPFRREWPRAAPQVWARVLEVGPWVRYRAGMLPGEGLAPFALLVGLGQVPGSLSTGPAARFYLEEARDTGVRALNALGLSGRTWMAVVAYDANNNRTERRFPLDLPPWGRSGYPQDLKAVAFTLPRPLGLLALAQATSVLVRLSWRGEGPYRLWREEGGRRVLLAHLPFGATAYADVGPGLLPGERVCYTLEGDEGAARACTTPLPPVGVEVVSPAPGEEVPPLPTFRWRVWGGEALNLRFQPVVWDQLTGGGLFLSPTSATEAVPPLPLAPGRPYALEMYQAYAVDNPQDPRALALAADRQGLLSGFPVPGPVVPFGVRP